MSDLTKDLLTQYYGIGSGTSGKKLLSIHQSVENVKNEEERQVTDQTSSLANEENVSDVESQKENEDNRKFSTASESYSLPQRIVDSIENVYDTDEVFDLFEIDFGPNIMCNDIGNGPPQNTPHDGLPNHVTSDYIKADAEDSEIETSDRGDSNENDLTLSYVEDHRGHSGNVAEVYSAKLKSPTSPEDNPNSPASIQKREPVYNEAFVDFSNTDLNQFPCEILYNFSQLRVSYFVK
ncbi:uncharacterized protein LOC108624489 [Ceratina calcarata]|uniref:Uncharacterized protein LOC108624489 n=1 Tax=Ceratina calcarata TaxID=156304 RepID=A0AAJ7WAC7_9HYME|nr:uncharacterized protein LOC108624489 [Ceratina calcarata]